MVISYDLVKMYGILQNSTKIDSLGQANYGAISCKNGVLGMIPIELNSGNISTKFFRVFPSW